MAMDDLARFSDALAALAASAGTLVVGLRAGKGRLSSGVLWRDGAIVTSEQALAEAEDYVAVLPGGADARATLAGRDRATNIAVLRVEAGAAERTRTEPVGPGALALALGTDGAGGCTARLAVIHRVGPAWHSMAGGRIDRLVRLDARLSGTEEGGPVLDARGGLLGISTLGPRRRALVIPHATVERALDPLLAEGRVARGWLGVALHPVALPDALRAAAECDAGLMVVALNAGGPAERAGVLPGDILLAVDGTRSTSLRALAERLGPERVGKECVLRLLRAGAVREIGAMVGARP